MDMNHTIREHYRVRNVLLSHGGAALTMEPVQYMRESATESLLIEGERVPTLELCEPGETDEPAFPTGGKMTEVRVEGATEFRPDDLVTLTLTYSK